MAIRTMSDLLKPVIGLEVHIQLKTKSKMFSSAPNRLDMEQPNVNVDEVVTAQPGSLPVANEEAIRLAVKMGLALNCSIDEWSQFDRKHYFYPDLPKGYQISQLDHPIAKEGFIEIQVTDSEQTAQPSLEASAGKFAGATNDASGVSKPRTRTKRVLIQRAHLEEDAGKNMHPEGLSYSLVDYNRAGTPLLEIVTHPVIESAEEARKYLEELQRIARYVGASDADMEKGSMRCEPSISVRLPGEQGLPPYKCEVKNINSFKFVEQAITYEIARQSEMRLRGETPKQVTMGWNEKLNQTVEQRSKEEANDYRYLPEPDLPPLQFTAAYVEEIRRSLPELPNAKRLRFSEEYALPEADIENLLNWKELAFFFEDVVSELDAWILSEQSSQKAVSSKEKLVKLAANWCLQDFSAALNSAHSAPADSRVTAENLAELVKLIDSGVISSAAAKQVFKKMLETGGDPSELVKDLGLEQVSDTAAIEEAIVAVLEENAKAAEDYKNGNERAFGALVGGVMKKMQGKANPSVINEILKQKLQS